MSLASVYKTIRNKVFGDPQGSGQAPWYTRWIWWVLIASVGTLVFTLWYAAKRREARAKADLSVAAEKAKAARLAAATENDKVRAAKLMKIAKDATKKADNLAIKIFTTGETRRTLEAAIKGAASWDELERIEEELK